MEMSNEKDLRLLEVVDVAVKFCGFDGIKSQVDIYNWPQEHLDRVLLEQQYGPESNAPTYSMSVSVKYKEDDKTIDFVEVLETQGTYDGFVNEMTSQFEGNFHTIDKAINLSKTDDGQLMVKTTSFEQIGHTNIGIDEEFSNETTDLYEFDGNWLNLSSDMKKVNQENQTAKKTI